MSPVLGPAWRELATGGWSHTHSDGRYWHATPDCHRLDGAGWTAAPADPEVDSEALGLRAEVECVTCQETVPNSVSDTVAWAEAHLGHSIRARYLADGLGAVAPWSDPIRLEDGDKLAIRTPTVE